MTDFNSHVTHISTRMLKQHAQSEISVGNIKEKVNKPPYRDQGPTVKSQEEKSLEFITQMMMVISTISTISNDVHCLV